MRRKPDIAEIRWWRATLRTVVPRDDGDARALYELAGDQATPGSAVDPRGRTALEAFTALDLPAPEAVVGGAPPARAHRARAARRSLAAFVDCFGPVGCDWGVVEVGLPLSAVPDADAPVGAAIAALGGPQPYWVAILDGLGPRRQGAVPVERRFRLRAADPAEQDRYDDSLPGDRLSRIAEEQRSLELTIDLADAVTRNDRLAAKTALSAFPDHSFPIGAPPTGSATARAAGWAEAHRGPWPFNGAWRPLGEGGTANWVRLAGLWLSLLLDQRLNFTKSTVALLPDGRFEIAPQATSLVEIMYRQLAHQLIDRPGFGFARCGHCGGRLVRTRKLGSRGNKWHRGCGAAGQRAARRASVRTRTDGEGV